ncbi:MAG: Fur family transcriptional regulator [Gaiellaceae bacterium]
MTRDGHTHEHRPLSAERLRHRGRRLTRPRRLIWQALAAEPEAHLSADEIADRVDGVDRSTVYRTLDLLVAEGLARRTDVGTGRSTYELAHEHLHHHLVCRGCGAVVHVHDEELGGLAASIDASLGWSVADEELTLAGLCPDCRRR